MVGAGDRGGAGLAREMEGDGGRWRGGCGSGSRALPLSLSPSLASERVELWVRIILLLLVRGGGLFSYGEIRKWHGGHTECVHRIMCVEVAGDL